MAPRESTHGGRYKPIGIVLSSAQAVQFTAGCRLGEIRTLAAWMVICQEELATWQLANLQPAFSAPRPRYSVHAE
jgi:hypothetical protein